MSCIVNILPFKDDLFQASNEIKKRWKLPFSIIGNLLSPFWIDGEKAKAHHHKRLMPPYEGRLELDVNVKKQDPVMDIHYLRSGSDEWYYKDINLDLVPEALSIQPTPGRFAPSINLFYKAGFRGTGMHNRPCLIL